MKFDRLVELTSELHCFSAGMLAAGESIEQLRVQLSRWEKAGKVLRLHAGWYTLAKPYRKILVSLIAVACIIKPGSYVSMHSALSYHGMIPEYVPETTCVTTGRPLVLRTPLGRIRYRHIKSSLFWGYSAVQDGAQNEFLALPEKALLDMLYFFPGKIDEHYIRELRLQNSEAINRSRLFQSAAQFGSPKMQKAASLILEYLEQEGEYL